MGVESLEDKGRWDQFVERSPQGSLFHKWGLLKTCRATFEVPLLVLRYILGRTAEMHIPVLYLADRLEMT